MSTRKNVKHLDSTERENFVRACVLMKADIVNPLAPVNDQYDRWDEFVAIHQMIQSGLAPGNTPVNFGHGGNPGTGAYSFLSWHREFLFRLEQQLQSYVPGVMIPYWDWTDPSSVLTDTFLGGSGAGVNNVITQGYFAVNRPGTGGNATALPGWWPLSLVGWRLSSAFGTSWEGGLKRSVGDIADLPSTLAIAEALGLNTYHNFQKALESGDGLVNDDEGMHNGMHVWLGGGFGMSTGHMAHPDASPFDPLFYLHHCNIDRLWAMWQMDGHETEYPLAGGLNFHHRNDIMYPWVGATPGYGTTAFVSSDIPMPDYSGDPIRRNVDTLDHRTAYNYTYDCMPIIGIGLDKTGSMNGMTPDPMVALAPDVTKWEAAKRGVSLFLQDCETVQESGTTYIHAGIKTFRSLGGNDFDNVFNGVGYGLIKDGTSFSQTSFDTLIAAHTPGGGTPLADALTDVNNTMTNAPFGNLPADERRYIALLTDGKLTTGSPMASIGNGSMAPNAVFAMGFGTGVAVDYATITALTQKGISLPTQQVFHGENAGVIDKFYTNALATAIGYTSIFDPLIELFEGEHTHIPFSATSAEDAFFITAQGFDFINSNWNYMLKGPDGTVHYGGHGMDHGVHNDCNHCCPKPHITAQKSKGRLSLVIQRNNSPYSCWVGQWQLVVMYKSKNHNAMSMPTIGEMMYPVGGGPIRGNQYNNLITRKSRRKPTRLTFSKPSNGLDTRGAFTNAEKGQACNNLINIYAKTRITIALDGESWINQGSNKVPVSMKLNGAQGQLSNLTALTRMVSPGINFEKFLNKEEVDKIIFKNERTKRPTKSYDSAIWLAKRLKEFENKRLVKDIELSTEFDNNALYFNKIETEFKGAYHLGILINGYYTPEYEDKSKHMCCSMGENKPEAFTRLINHSFAVV